MRCYTNIVNLEFGEKRRLVFVFIPKLSSWNTTPTIFYFYFFHMKIRVALNFTCSQGVGASNYLNFTYTLYILYLQASKAQEKDLWEELLALLGRCRLRMTTEVWVPYITQACFRVVFLFCLTKKAGPCNKLQEFNRTPQTRLKKTNPTWTICSTQEERRKVQKGDDERFVHSIYVL